MRLVALPVVVALLMAAGNDSLNLQAGGNITVGLSYSDARSVALDVFRSNFHELSDVAARVARERAEELTDGFLKKMEESGAKAVSEANNPDFQYALFTAQREYARSGDTDLGALLVQLLVDRTKENQRNLIQIVLNESLAVAPKLTPEQLDALSLVFLLKYTKYNGFTDIESLGRYFDEYIVPFLGQLSKKASLYQHLEFASCGTVGIGSISIQGVLLKNYAGLFSKGFTQADIETRSLTFDRLKPILIKGLHDPAKFQIKSLDEQALVTMCQTHTLTTDECERVKQLQQSSLMTDIEVKSFAIRLRSPLQALFDVWENSLMQNLSLTSVGIAIGHANIQRRTGKSFDLSIWI